MLDGNRDYLYYIVFFFKFVECYEYILFILVRWEEMKYMFIFCNFFKENII